MSYEEKRVRVRDYLSLPESSPLLVSVPGTKGRDRKLHYLAALSLGQMSVSVEHDLGIVLLVQSGHRRHRWASRAAYETAMIAQYGSVTEGSKWKAFNSPHETGLAMDIGVGGLEPRRATADAQRETPLHRWLVEHAHEYGWHPYKREPWHWEHPVALELYEREPVG